MKYPLVKPKIVVEFGPEVVFPEQKDKSLIKTQDWNYHKHMWVLDGKIINFIHGDVTSIPEKSLGSILRLYEFWLPEDFFYKKN